MKKILLSKFGPVCISIFLLFQGINVTYADVTINQGDIFIADPMAFNGGGGISKVDPITGKHQEVSSEGTFRNPSDLVIAEDGNLFVLDDDSIIQVNPITGIQTIISTERFSGFAISQNGDLYGAGGNFSPGSDRVIRINPISSDQTLISSGGLLEVPTDIVVAENGDLFVVDITSLGGAIIKIDPVSGDQIALSSGGHFIEPRGISISRNGDLFVADIAGKVIRVDSETGSQTLISSGSGLVSA